jgi:thiol-disulfide isomerase/thioredoxin
LRLPENSIGISDIQSYRDCARRMEFGMQRWTEEGEAPEAQGPSTAYGTIVHDVLHWIEEDGLSDDDAIQRAVDNHARWIEPETIETLREDLATYHTRNPTGVRLVGSEIELRVPLTIVDGQQIYFRGRIDRLYQSLADPSVFIAIDYKSSKWRKSKEEIAKDPQQWAYNWLIHEYFPEIERLDQFYDQLNYGKAPIPTKSAAQREQIREWLIKQVRAIVRDEKLSPTFNDWCPWCPIMESCRVIHRLSAYALGELAVIAPEVPKLKADGTPGKQVDHVDLDPDLFETYAEELPRVKTAKAVLERFEQSVQRALRDMPAARREALGYRLSKRSAEVFPADAVEALHRALGDDDFYRAIKLTKTQVQAALASDPERLARILGMAEKVRGATVLVPTRRD